MFFKPAIMALFLGSLLISGMLLYAAYFGVIIARHWNLQNGSGLQLHLERKTYLLSTILAYAFGFQLASLFLFVATADHLHLYFKGAMCAVGSLNVNRWGHTVVLMKVLNFLLAGLWLIVNFADSQGYDYPLIKKKYVLLLGITPLVLFETIIQANYFSDLKPEVITSCCGTLFSSRSKGIASELAGLPLLPMEIGFFASMVGLFAASMYFYKTRKGGYALAVMSLIAFLVSLASLISFISLYIYELPTHHCPFCLLHREYNYMGYPFYLALLLGAISGVGVGVLMPFKNMESLRASIPLVQMKLNIISFSAFLFFAFNVAYYILFSNLKL